MLTPTQSRTSMQIYDAVPDFPKVLTELISQYYSYDDLTDLAQTSIKVVNTNKQIDVGGRSMNHGEIPLFEIENPEELEAVTYCLISPDCCPLIKEAVIKNFLLATDTVKYNFFDHNAELSSYTDCVDVQPKLVALKCLFTALNKKINLNNTNLSGLDFSFFDLTGITAVGAKFRKSIFHYTRMSQANFTFADFSGAIFHSSKLESSMLAGANFSKSNLYSTNMRSANFTGADLTGITTTITSLIDINRPGVTEIDLSDFQDAVFFKTRVSQSGYRYFRQMNGKNWEISKS